MINNFIEWQIFFNPKTESLDVTYSNILMCVWLPEEALHICRVLHFCIVALYKYEGLRIHSFTERKGSMGRMFQCFLRLGSGL